MLHASRMHEIGDVVEIAAAQMWQRRAAAGNLEPPCPQQACDPLVAPDMKFHRSIGEFAGQTWSVRGERLTAEEYARHTAAVLPNEDEKQLVRDLMKEPGWIAPREEITAS